VTSIGAHSNSLFLEGPFFDKITYYQNLPFPRIETLVLNTWKVTSVGAHPSGLLLEGLHEDLEFVEGKSLDWVQGRDVLSSDDVVEFVVVGWKILG
jgi:hypothetical protein